jgi:hypothetical protein
MKDSISDEVSWDSYDTAVNNVESMIDIFIER